MEYQEFFDLMNFLNNENYNNYFLYLEHLNNLNLNENQNICRKYHVRKRRDPMNEYDDSEFERRFRFTKREVKTLYDLLDGQATLEPKVIVVISVDILDNLHSAKHFNILFF